MEVFVKSFAAYRTIKKATSLTESIVLDSLETEASSLVVKGTEINRLDIGNWLVVEGAVFSISGVVPSQGKTTISLKPALDAFSRPIVYAAPAGGSTIGSFITDQLVTHWRDCADPAYAVPYLLVSNSDTKAFALPELDDSGCYTLPEYCRLMRKSYGTLLSFRDSLDGLVCAVSNPQPAVRQISFEDGRSTLQSVSFADPGAAKLTVFHTVKTGDTEETTQTVWYLAEDGSVSQEVPSRRAAGSWDTLSLKGDVDVAAKVAESFAKSNSGGHKLEFLSSIDLNILDRCTTVVYGQEVASYISYKRKGSDDNRYLYKSGELATTASEKLRGVIK